MNEKSLIVITSARFPGTAGDTANYTEMLNQLAEDGYDIIVICPRSMTNLKDSYIHSRVRITRIPLSPPRLEQLRGGFRMEYLGRFVLFSMLQSLAIIWKLRRRTVKYAYMRHAILNMTAPFLLKMLGLKVIVADGEIFSDSVKEIVVHRQLSKILKFYENRVLKVYSHFRVSTTSQARRMSLLGYPEERILHMPMSINIDQIPVIPIEQIPPHTFCFFGALESWQGPDVLLSAFKLLVKHIPTAILYVIGNGSMKESLKHFVAKNGLSQNVIFVDGIPRKIIWDEYFRKFRIAVIPRPKRNDFWDSLPSIKLIEALAGGKAVIATKIDAMNELPAGVIRLVPANDPDALSSEMYTLSNNELLICKTGGTAIEYAKKYHIRMNIHGLEKIFT